MSENPSTPIQTVLFFIWNLIILVGMVMCFMVMGFFAGAYCSRLFWGIDVISNPQLLSTIDATPSMIKSMKLIQALMSFGGMVIPAWFFPKSIQQNSATFLKTTANINPLNFVFAVVLMLVSIPLVSWLIEMNARLQLPASFAQLEAALKANEDAATQITKLFMVSTTTTDLMVNLLVIAIIPAIAEEFLFRGALQQFLVLSFKNIHIAVIVGAAIFSAFHGQIYGFVPRWFLGILLGYLFAYSGSVWPGILAHFVNNALTVLVVHFKLDETTIPILKDDYHFPLYIVLLSTVICLGLLYLLNKRYLQQNHGNPLD